MISKADKLWEKAMIVGAKSGCHQIPERSFFLGSYQFPVCARCTGVLIGHIMSIFCIKKKLPVMCIFSMCLTTLADWTAQALGRESNNKRRLVTGILGGFGTGYVFLRVVFLMVGSVLKRHK